MANEQRLIDADALWGEVEKSQRNNPHVDGRVKINHRQEHDHFLKMIFDAPTVDAVEASRLGYLGRLMMPYKGCPRGRMGARGDGRIIELDPIKDVEGDIWVPVLEEDLNFLKAKAVEVVHGRWVDAREYCGDYMCSNCDALYGTNKFNYCPNCGAKMFKNENP